MSTENMDTLCDGKAVVERHDMYYFDFAVFQVQTTLFRVPKHGFLNSNPAFFDKFAPANVTGAQLGEYNEADPIELQDVTADYFKALLLVLYPFKRTAETYEEWLGALDLATQWELVDIRSKAVVALSRLNKLEKKSSVEVILLAKQYRIKEWLVKSYVQLIHSDDLNLRTLRQQEPENGKLDWETISRLFSARLEVIQWARSRACPWGCERGRLCLKDCKLQSSQNQAKAQIESAFVDELAPLVTENLGMPQSSLFQGQDSNGTCLPSNNLAHHDIHTNYVGGRQYPVDTADVPTPQPPQPEWVEAVIPIHGHRNDGAATDDDYTDTEDEVEVNCRQDREYNESEDEDDDESDNEVVDESADEDDDEPVEELYESEAEDDNEPIEEHHNEPADEEHNDPEPVYYHEPEDEDYDEPEPEYFNEPEDDDYNEPEPELYNEPEDEDYIEPEDEQFNEPDDEDYNESEDEVQSDSGVEDDYSGMEDEY